MKTQYEIEEMLDLAENSEDFLGMSYGDGVKAALEWALGYISEPPFDEENRINEGE